MQEQIGFQFPDFAKAKKANRLVRVIFNADLRSGHRGLTDACKKVGLNPRDLEVGEYIIFVNTKKTMLKAFASGESVVAHFRMPGHRTINVKVLRYLPRFFNGGELRYGAALDELVKKEVRVQ